MEWYIPCDLNYVVSSKKMHQNINNGYFLCTFHCVMQLTCIAFILWEDIIVFWTSVYKVRMSPWPKVACPPRTMDIRISNKFPDGVGAANLGTTQKLTNGD